MTLENQTIVALASGAGVAGVAVVRVSGPHADEVRAALTPKSVPARKAVLRTLAHPESGATLDRALLLWFPAPASFTGEDVLELHLHGGRAVIDGVLDAILTVNTVRLAEPGEFSRRAFDHGKMDLTEAEGLNDLIHAQTSAQRDQAMRQMDGALSALYEEWRTTLVGHLAHLEADIDFPDEDLPDGVAGAVRTPLKELSQEIKDHLADGRRGEALRDGFRIALLGAPNAGKSTLMNRLARADVAIVSDEAGTTRDVIEVRLDLGGFPVRLIDTAGVRASHNKIEAEGVRRALARAEEADLRLILVPVGERLADDLMQHIDGHFLVVTKSDVLCEKDPMFHVKHIASRADQHFLLSAESGDGMDRLLAALEAYVSKAMGLREAPSLTRHRHRRSLEDCVSHLDRFQDNVGLDAVLAAEDVRMAARALGEITGRVGVEDILDRVFGDFCIGK